MYKKAGSMWHRKARRGGGGGGGRRREGVKGEI
jgi:hypothetical protein